MQYLILFLIFFSLQSKAETIEIPIDFVVLADSGWTREEVKHELNLLNEIYGQCEVHFAQNSFSEISPDVFGFKEFPDHVCGYNTGHHPACSDHQEKLTTLDLGRRRANLNRLTVYFIKKIVNYGYDDGTYYPSAPLATAYRKGANYRELEDAMPELTNTVWIDRGAQVIPLKDLVLSHEVAHVLTNSPHNGLVGGNILADELQYRSRSFTKEQCEEMHHPLTN